MVCSSGKAIKLKHREMVKECSAGDLIVHYCSPYIRAISKAKTDGRAYNQNTLPHPDLAEHFEHGWFFETDYFELASPLHKDKFAALLAERRNKKDILGYPVGPQGNIRQEYFIPFDNTGYEILCKLIENLPQHLSPTKYSNRISASEIYRIEGQDLRQAIADIDHAKTPHDFAESTRFDLLINGHRRYPPKTVVGLAAKRSFGRVLSNKEFSGGESSTAFRLLWSHGFEVVTKSRKVGFYDATFSVGRSNDSTFMIFESRGPNRNTDYHPGLESLLNNLADLDASLVAAVLDTQQTRDLKYEDRQLILEDHKYPVILREVPDLNQLRRDLTSSAGSTGTSRGKDKGGNPTKRIRLELSLPGELTLHELAEVLAEGKGQTAHVQREFKFQPKAPRGSSDIGERKAMDATVVTYLHFEMQRSLYDSLIKTYNKDDVATEQPTISGRPADVVVQINPDLFEIYEIKTAKSPCDCVRQALGQLLEYSFWPGSPKCNAIWVVGPSPIDANTKEYLDTLKEDFKLPIGYVHQPV